LPPRRDRPGGDGTRNATPVERSRQYLSGGGAIARLGRAMAELWPESAGHHPENRKSNAARWRSKLDVAGRVSTSQVQRYHNCRNRPSDGRAMVNLVVESRKHMTSLSRGPVAARTPAFLVPLERTRRSRSNGTANARIDPQMAEQSPFTVRRSRKHLTSLSRGPVAAPTPGFLVPLERARQA
jgi:hypothetical protein